MKNTLIAVLIVLLGAGCATDSRRLKESREAFERGDFAKAESALFTEEVLKASQNRALHYLQLGSVAVAQGRYEKAAVFFQKARDQIKSVRGKSDFSLAWGGDYQSNGIEFSYIHYYLVLCYSLLAESESLPEWSIPEFKNKKGVVLIPGEVHPARNLDSKERAKFRIKARAELLAWDTHLQNLERSVSVPGAYREDPFARTLGSSVHGLSGQNSERQVARLLLQQAKTQLDGWSTRFSTVQKEKEGWLEHLASLKTNADLPLKASSQAHIIVESGVMDSLQVKKYVIGLSTLFREVKDPATRRLLEEIGVRIILETAPEFGLVLFAGGLMGAATASSDDADSEEEVHYFTDAVDRGLGFEIKFPYLKKPPERPEMTLALQAQNQPELVIPLKASNPLQEVIAHEFKVRQDQDFYKRAIEIGVRYLAILIPAIKAYREATGEGSGFKKLMILTGYMIAKKALDASYAPDLRSWSYLPQWIAFAQAPVSAGAYKAILRKQTAQGKTESVLFEHQKFDPTVQAFIFGRDHLSKP